MRQVERAEVVDAQSHFEVLLSSVSWWDEDTSVVDKDVQGEIALLVVLCKAFD